MGGTEVRLRSQTFSVVRIAQDSVNSTQTLADITGAAIPIAANERLSFVAYLLTYAAAATTGVQWGASGPASPTRVRLNGEHILGNGNVAAVPLPANAFGAIGIAHVSTLATAAPGQMGRIYGSITNGANAGTIQLQFASEVGGSAITVEAGSYILVYR